MEGIIAKLKYMMFKEFLKAGDKKGKKKVADIPECIKEVSTSCSFYLYYLFKGEEALEQRARYDKAKVAFKYADDCEKVGREKAMGE